jgi:hypothetical protein
MIFGVSFCGYGQKTAIAKNIDYPVKALKGKSLVKINQMLSFPL